MPWWSPDPYTRIHAHAPSTLTGDHMEAVVRGEP